MCKFILWLFIPMITVYIVVGAVWTDTDNHYKEIVIIHTLMFAW